MIRPLVTFALVVYKQERFVEEAIRSALAQDYRPLEILITDDASPDGTSSVIGRVLDEYAGPVPVRVIRNPTNIGLIATINRLMEEANGEIIVGAAGDDVSIPTRTTETVRLFVEDSDVHSVYANAIVIDSDGREQRLFYPDPPDATRHLLSHAAREGLAVLGASHAWRRRVFDIFGPLPTGGSFEDHGIAFRSAFLGSIRYLDRVLIRYRQHGENIFLGTTGVDGTVEEWHRGMEQFTRRERGMLLARLEDLEVALQKFPERRETIVELRALTELAVEERTDQIRLLAGASLLDRIATIVSRAWSGMPPRRVARWVLTFLLPGYYLRRIRRRSAVVPPTGFGSGS